MLSFNVAGSPKSQHYYSVSSSYGLESFQTYPLSLNFICVCVVCSFYHQYGMTHYNSSDETNVVLSKEVLEETIGECLGLERAAQKAVEELDAKGLLKEDAKSKIMNMQEEAGEHEEKLETLIETVAESEGLDADSIEKHAEETVEKTSEMMKIYLGEDPEELDALEFLGIAEGGEVIHYQVLSRLASKVKNKKFATGINAILRQEDKHLQMCIKLAQKAAAESKDDEEEEK